MKYWQLIPLGLVASCGPGDSAVRTEFLADHPQATVTFVGPGEGDDANVLYHIRYRLPADTTVWEQVWLYQKGPNGRWQVTHRDSSIAKRAT